MAQARGLPSEGMLTMEGPSWPGTQTLMAVEPPPSRLTAQTQPWGEHLLRQIQLAQSAGVAAPAAVHSVQDQGAVLPHAQGGAGVAALFHIGPGSGVSDLSVPDHHIAHAAGPLGVLEGGGGAVGAEGDPVAHLEALEYGLQAAGVGGSQYVLVLANDH